MTVVVIVSDFRKARSGAIGGVLIHRLGGRRLGCTRDDYPYANIVLRALARPGLLGGLGLLLEYCVDSPSPLPIQAVRIRFVPFALVVV